MKHLPQRLSPALRGTATSLPPHRGLQLGVWDQLEPPQCRAGVQLGRMRGAQGAGEMRLSGTGGLQSCAKRDGLGVG